jgi:hypothetical protein
VTKVVRTPLPQFGAVVVTLPLALQLMAVVTTLQPRVW